MSEDEKKSPDTTDQSPETPEEVIADEQVASASESNESEEPETAPFIIDAMAPADPDDAEAEPEEPRFQVIPILPLRGTVVFPLTVVPLAAAQARSLRLIDDVMSGDRTVGLILQNDAEMDSAGPNDVKTIGTIGSILQMMRVPDGSVRLAVQGSERMRIVEWLDEEPFLTARVERIPDTRRRHGRGRGPDQEHARTVPAPGFARLALAR